MATKSWKPELASRDIEERMESKDLSETERDEVRRFSEFLGRVARKRNGDTLDSAPVGMKEWVTGQDVA